MPARRPQEATDAFLEPVQRIVSCVSDAVMYGSGRRPASEPHTLTIGGQNYARLRGPDNLLLMVTHRYRLVQGAEARTGWRVNTAEYIYTLLDLDERPLLAWHWHPQTGRGPHRITYPHLHVYGQTTLPTLPDRHPPTGRVSLEAVIRFVIDELGVEPRRPDWRAILDETEAVFKRDRSWA